MSRVIRISRDQTLRLWFLRQGLSQPRRRKLTRAAFVEHLERTGGLQLDSVNVLERAHYLTLWSRFGVFDRAAVDRWVYQQRVAYEYWGHEACVLPASRLPLSRRGMRRFSQGSWWQKRVPSPAAFRKVLGRLRAEGPLQSADFSDSQTIGDWWGWKEDKQVLELLWHRGRVAVSHRQHFRRYYDLAERVYPQGPAASLAEYEDGWLLVGLAGNGVATARHLENYFTAPRLKADRRRAVIARNLRKGRIVEVQLAGLREPCWALPEQLEQLARLPRPRGTTLLSPFDSLLWQRRRAQELLDFHYRVELYVPPPKRTYGYYVMPILHHGALVGRLDPKLHRDRGTLQIKAIYLEPGQARDSELEAGLADALEELGRFVDAKKIELPRGWRKLM